MKDNQHKQLFNELTPEEAASCSGGTYLLKLHSIEAVSMNEYYKDEPFINIGGTRVWKGSGFQNGTNYTFPQDDGAVVSIFGNSTEIRLYEEDLGHWPDKHDYLGKHAVNGSQAGQGLQTAEFKQDGHYILKYNVIDI